MVPKNQPAPATLAGGNLDDAKKAQRTLIEAGHARQGHLRRRQRRRVRAARATPSSSCGKGDGMTARLVIYDNQARRTSAITADKILTLRAREAPLPYLWIGGATFAGVVLVLLVVSVVRGGGGGRRRRRGAPRPDPAAGWPPAPPVRAAPGARPPMGAAPAGAARPATAAPPPAGRAHAGRHRRARRASSPSRPGLEMRVGRDGAACQILLTEPRVSGTHAVLKFEAGQLLVRDESSNNGTYLNGQRIPAGDVDPDRPRRRPPLRPRRVCRPFGVGSAVPVAMNHEPQASGSASRSTSPRRAIPAAIRTSRSTRTPAATPRPASATSAVLCDGMGGHYGGKEASRTAITTIFEMFEQMPTTMAPGAGPQGAIEEAGRRVYLPRRPAGQPHPPRLDGGRDAPPRPGARRGPRRRQPRVHHPLEPDLPAHPRPLDGAGDDRRRDAHRRERHGAPRLQQDHARPRACAPTSTSSSAPRRWSSSPATCCSSRATA